MKKTLLAVTTALAVMAAGASYAQPGKGAYQPPKTRAEAIERTKARLSELQSHLQSLEKMTDQEWAAEQQKRKSRRDEKGKAKAAGKQ